MWPERTALQAETGWIKEAPSNEEAIEYVTMKQVERGHWSNEAKEYYYAKRAEALGVRTKAENQHVSNDTSSPSLRGNERVSISSSNGREWCRSKAQSNPSSGK